MSRHPYPCVQTPRVTVEGGSCRITIPSGVGEALDLEGGEQPEAIEFDAEDREFLMRFESEDDESSTKRW